MIKDNYSQRLIAFDVASWFYVTNGLHAVVSSSIEFGKRSHESLMSDINDYRGKLAKNVKEALYEYSIKALASELRHIYGHSSVPRRLQEEGLVKDCDALEGISSSVRYENRRTGRTHFIRCRREFCIETAGEFSPIPFLTSAEKLFGYSDGKNVSFWSSAYGGKTWAFIANRMLMYDKIDDNSFCDMCFGLSHNSTFYLNKESINIFTLHTKNYSKHDYIQLLDDKFNYSVEGFIAKYFDSLGSELRRLVKRAISLGFLKLDTLITSNINKIDRTYKDSEEEFLLQRNPMRWGEKSFKDFLPDYKVEYNLKKREIADVGVNIRINHFKIGDRVLEYSRGTWNEKIVVDRSYICEEKEVALYDVRQKNKFLIKPIKKGSLVVSNSSKAKNFIDNGSCSWSKYAVGRCIGCYLDYGIAFIQYQNEDGFMIRKYDLRDILCIDDLIINSIDKFIVKNATSPFLRSLLDGSKEEMEERFLKNEFNLLRLLEDSNNHYLNFIGKEIITKRGTGIVESLLTLNNECGLTVRSNSPSDSKKELFFVADFIFGSSSYVLEVNKIIVEIEVAIEGEPIKNYSLVSHDDIMYLLYERTGKLYLLNGIDLSNYEDIREFVIGHSTPKLMIGSAYLISNPLIEVTLTLKGKPRKEHYDIISNKEIEADTNFIKVDTHFKEKARIEEVSDDWYF